MYRRTKMYASSDFSPKNDEDKRIAEEVVKQSEIRRILRRPVRDEETLQKLCMVLLLDTDNIVVAELNKRRKVQHITSVPLCFEHAMTSYRYLYTVLGTRDFAYRAIAVQLRSTDEDTMDDYINIIDRFREISDPKDTIYLMCHRFNIYPVKGISYESLDIPWYMMYNEDTIEELK